MLAFRERLTFDQRKLEFERVKRKRPEYVPTIIVRGSKDAPYIDKEKYLVPKEVTSTQMSFIVRRRLNMRADQALFLFCDNRILGPNHTMVQLAQEFADEDGFLYLTYTLENTFG